MLGQPPDNHHLLPLCEFRVCEAEHNPLQAVRKKFSQQKCASTIAEAFIVGGAAKGGAKPHEETPHGNQLPISLTSVCFAPSPNPISLIKSLRNLQNFPQVTTSETFRRVSKTVSKGPSSRGFAFENFFGTFCPPPLALPSFGKSNGGFSEGVFK